MRKHVLVAAAVVFAVLLLAVGGAAAGEKLTKIRVAYHPNLGPMTIPAADLKNDFFKKEGLDVEWVRFTSGPSEIAAMVSGDISYGYIGHGALVLCVEGKAEVLSLSHFSNSEALLVRKNSGIKTMADLKGRTLGTELGTSGEVILDLACRKYGVDRKDIKVINMPISSAISAFIGGSIDAVVAWGPDILTIKNNVGEDLVSIIETKDFVDIVPFLSTWIAATGYADANPDQTRRFLRALYKCYDYRGADVDRIIRDAADFAKKADLGVNYENLAGEKEQMVFLDTAAIKKGLDDGQIRKWFQLHLDYMKKSGRVKEGDVNKYVRFDFMQTPFE